MTKHIKLFLNENKMGKLIVSDDYHDIGQLYCSL